MQARNAKIILTIYVNPLYVIYEHFLFYPRLAEIEKVNEREMPRNVIFLKNDHFSAREGEAGLDFIQTVDACHTTRHVVF